MGVDLMGRHGSYSVNWRAWRFLVATAVANGWKPAGVVHDDWLYQSTGSYPEKVVEIPIESPAVFKIDFDIRELASRIKRLLSPQKISDDDVDRNLAGYFSNDAQKVTDEDAKSMANALDRALASECDDPDDVILIVTCRDFCREGGFRIL